MQIYLSVRWILTFRWKLAIQALFFYFRFYTVWCLPCSLGCNLKIKLMNYLILMSILKFHPISVLKRTITWNHGNGTVFNVFAKTCIHVWPPLSYIYIFSINLVSQVTLRSSGTDILYDCHLLRYLHNILYFPWLYDEFFIILYNILKIAELDCCQIIILSIYVPSTHA